LNIVERKQWVRSYLGCYLILLNDVGRCVHEDEPLPLPLITRVKELIHLCVVSLERLAILLHQGVECGLDDVVLIEVRFIDVGASHLEA
jgi:hypothetical protein